MELEFDKEIDSLLRRADRGLAVGKNGGDGLGPHLDADEISAFAENLVPERIRPLYMSHLADCDRCRGILSGLIALNAEAEPAEQSIIAPALVPTASSEPWYRRFLLSNLAYVMGGLVLIFGGLIAISLLRSSQMEQAATVSQAVESERARGPMAAQPGDSTYSMNSNAATGAANTAVNANKAPSLVANAANASQANAVGRSLETRSQPIPAHDRTRVSADGADVNVAAAAPAPAAPPPPKTEADEMLSMKPAVRRDEDAKVEEVKKKDVEGERAEMAVNARQAKELPRTQAGGLAKSTPGPSRELQQNFPNRANNTFDMNE
ncbi:MAG TPA: hypothetical protein VFZ49_02950, partial [Pyrinomonadaceae bacterium]